MEVMITFAFFCFGCAVFGWKATVVVLLGALSIIAILALLVAFSSRGEGEMCPRSNVDRATCPCCD